MRLVNDSEYVKWYNEDRRQKILKEVWYHVVIHLVISRFMMRRLQRKNVSKWLEILWNIGKQRRQELNRNKFYKKKVLFEI